MSGTTTSPNNPTPPPNKGRQVTFVGTLYKGGMAAPEASHGKNGKKDPHASLRASCVQSIEDLGKSAEAAPAYFSVEQVEAAKKQVSKLKHEPDIKRAIALAQYEKKVWEDAVAAFGAEVGSLSAVKAVMQNAEPVFGPRKSKSWIDVEHALRKSSSADFPREKEIGLLPEVVDLLDLKTTVYDGKVCLGGRMKSQWTGAWNAIAAHSVANPTELESARELVKRIVADLRELVDTDPAASVSNRKGGPSRAEETADSSATQISGNACDQETTGEAGGSVPGSAPNSASEATSSDPGVTVPLPAASNASKEGEPTAGQELSNAGTPPPPPGGPDLPVAQDPSPESEREQAIAALNEALKQGTEAGLYSKVVADKILASLTGEAAASAAELREQGKLILRKTALFKKGGDLIDSMIKEVAEHSVRESLIKAKSGDELDRVEARLKGLFVVSEQLRGHLRFPATQPSEISEALDPRTIATDLLTCSDDEVPGLRKLEEARLALWRSLSPEQIGDRAMWADIAREFYPVQEQLGAPKHPRCVRSAILCAADVAKLEEIASAYRSRSTEEDSIPASSLSHEDLQNLEVMRAALRTCLGDEVCADSALWHEKAPQIYAKYKGQIAIPDSLEQSLVSRNDPEAFNLLDDIALAYGVSLQRLRDAVAQGSGSDTESRLVDEKPHLSQSDGPASAPMAPGEVLAGHDSLEREIDLPEWAAVLKSSGAAVQLTDAGPSFFVDKDGRAVMACKQNGIDFEVEVSREALQKFASLDEAAAGLLLKGFEPSPAHAIDNDFIRHVTLSNEFKIRKFLMPKGQPAESVGLNLRCVPGAELFINAKNSVVRIEGAQLNLKYLGLKGSSVLSGDMPQAIVAEYSLDRDVVVKANFDGAKFIKGRNEADMVASSMRHIEVENFPKSWKGVRFNFNTVTEDTFKKDSVRPCENYSTLKQELNIKAFKNIISDQAGLEKIIRGYSGASAKVALPSESKDLTAALAALGNDGTHLAFLECSLPKVSVADGAASVFLVTPQASSPAIKDGELMALGVVTDTAQRQGVRLSVVDLEANIDGRPETSGFQYALAKYLEWLTLDDEKRKKYLKELAASDMLGAKPATDTTPAQTVQATEPKGPTPVSAPTEVYLVTGDETVS